jgi:hypothetical protein
MIYEYTNESESISISIKKFVIVHVFVGDFLAPHGATSCITGGGAKRNHRIPILQKFKPR